MNYKTVYDNHDMLTEDMRVVKIGFLNIRLVYDIYDIEMKFSLLGDLVKIFLLPFVNCNHNIILVHFWNCV